MAQYSSSEILEIVNTINRQINATAGFWVVGSWGVSKRVATLYNGMPALGLRVSGVYHKGWVYVCYNAGTDLYDVRFVNTRGALKKSLDDVYADVLADVLDRNIERGYTSEDVYMKRAAADTTRKMQYNR